MASCTKVTQERRRLRQRNAGRKRKNKIASHSTLSYAELFAACGAPGEPAPRAAK